ncbi:MAG: alanine:cation symporter family protein, partial [Cyanobacteriota bacterium]|nr:alanine:cation symporter family protein [Cyanobacteriota bacterium]
TYVLGCLAMLVPHLADLPEVLATIVQQGLSPRAIASGTILVAISNGIRLGVLSNEAGMGTSPIILSVGKPGHPFYQACISMLLSLADVVVCTATALVVLLSGSDLRSQSPIAVVNQAFDAVWPGSHWLLLIAAVPFTFTTFTAFAYYGERCLEYLCGERSNQIYRLLWVGLMVVGAVVDLDIIWKSTELLNAFVALPNIIGVVVLSNKVFQQTRSLLPPQFRLNHPQA